MKIKKFIKTAAAAVLAAVMAVAPACGVLAAPADTIDPAQKGSMKIHKYDMTAAQQKGIDISKYKADGKQNAEAESELANYVIEGVEFTYFRVGDIVTYTEGGEIEVLYQVPQALATILGLSSPVEGDKYESDDVNEALKTLLGTSGDGTNTAAKNQLEQYVVTGGTRMTETDAQGVTSASNLQVGLYLVVETKVPANVHTTTDPFFVSIPMTDLEGNDWFYDVELYPKNQTNFPTLDKQVRQDDDATKNGEPDYHDTATVSEGDKVDYVIISHLPRITSEASYLTEYTFTDTLCKGLEYNKDAQIYIFDSDSSPDWDPSDASQTFSSGDFTADYSSASGGGGTAKFSLTQSGLDKINPECTEKWIVVAYSCTVLSDASPTLGDAGNTNDVQLDWRRTSSTHVDHEKARARVYTYGLNVTKLFQSDSEHPEGDATAVKFILHNDTDDYYVKASSTSAGVYYVTDADQPEDEEDATIFSPNSSGSLIINGLEADTYTITEVETSDGYSLLKDSITVVINETTDEFTPSVTTLYDSEAKASNPNKEVIEEEGTRASATVDGNLTNMSNPTSGVTASTNGLVDIQITNTPDFKLPATGGLGTILFTLAGCGVAFAGIAFLTKKKKKKDEEED